VVLWEEKGLWVTEVREGGVGGVDFRSELRALEQRYVTVM
jgi:hypothetical protein